jgi:hypothetical protein
LNSILNNAVSYSYGFLDGVDIEQIVFNQELAKYTIEALNKFIDSNARMSPEALHHVYEWGQVGNAGSRLFQLKSKVSKRVIHIYGDFLPSKSVSGENSEPFVNKAEVMENGISVTIEPVNSDVLVFEDEDGLVFTSDSIYVEHPGGDSVAGSFGRVVDEFFEVYFTNSLLRPFIASLGNPVQYAQSFAAGTRGGASVGVRAGRKYLKEAGGTIL